MLRRLSAFTLMILLLLTCNAQDFAQDHGRWYYLIEPYVMFPTMEGTVGVGQLPDVEVTSGNIFDHLQSGFMLYAEAHDETWAFSSDLLYMNLKQDAVPTAVLISGSVSMSETAWELAALRKFFPCLEVGIGARLVGLTVNMETVRNDVEGGTVAQSSADTRTWFDPVLLVRMTLTDSRQWLAQLRGDIGGFGIGSDLTWQVQAYAGYRFSDVFQATVGYRVLAIDYTTGSEKERFLYDVTTSGPVVRIGFNL